MISHLAPVLRSTSVRLECTIGFPISKLATAILPSTVITRSRTAIGLRGFDSIAGAIPARIAARPLSRAGVSGEGRKTLASGAKNASTPSRSAAFTPATKPLMTLATSPRAAGRGALAHEHESSATANANDNDVERAKGFGRRVSRVRFLSG